MILNYFKFFIISLIFIDKKSFTKLKNTLHRTKIKCIQNTSAYIIIFQIKTLEIYFIQKLKAVEY